MLEVKSRLREMLKEYRNQISEERWNQIAVEIQKNVLDLLKKLSLNSVGCYIKSQKSREISTDIILKSLLESGLKTYVPVVGDNFTMDMVIINMDTVYSTNSWGIPEPVDFKKDDSSIPEVVIIPMLGADYRGYRIGYGKGYYDRYLSKNDVVKIGICPISCVIHELPIDQFDIPMDYLITEIGIIRRNA